MSIDNVLAGVAVKHLATAAKWYEQLIGRAGKQPMDGVLEWTLPRGGVLQLFEDADRAGSSSVTLSLSDIDAHLARLSHLGITPLGTTRTDDVSTAIIEDPDGNRVVLAEPHSELVAR